MQPKVSVIVAVYNAEKYITRCIESLLSQTLKDFEVIIIDDGSPDRSGAICDEYAQKDSRIRVFHKENGGVASARQMGIDNARGEYSIHADPDDWVEPNMLEELYAKAKENDADMVICDFYVETLEKHSYVSQRIGNTSSSFLLEQILGGGIHGSTCNKLIRTSLYSKYKVKFPVNMCYMEDTFVICCILEVGIKVGYLPKAFYHYDNYSNPNSLTFTTGHRMSKSSIYSIMFFIDYFENNLSKSRFSSGIEKRKIECKQRMWYSQLFNKSIFINKYKEVNTIIYNQYKKGERNESKSLALALNGYYYPMVIIRLFRQIVSRIR